MLLKCSLSATITLRSASIHQGQFVHTHTCHITGIRTWWASSVPQNHDDSNHKIVSPFNYSSCKYRLPISDVHLNDCQGLPIHPASIRTRQVYDDNVGWLDKERPQNLSAQPASHLPTALVIDFWHNLKTSVLSLSKTSSPAFLCSRACVTEPGVLFKPLCFPSMLMSFTPDSLPLELVSSSPYLRFSICHAVLQTNELSESTDLFLDKIAFQRFLVCFSGDEPFGSDSGSCCSEGFVCFHPKNFAKICR